MKLPPFLQFSTSANDWRNDVELLAKGNTATVCLFTEPDPALRDRFDGETECTQEGHSLNGQTPDAETTISFNRLRKEYRNAQMLFTSAIRLSLDDSTKQASKLKSPSETDFNALLQWVDKSYGRNNASSASSYLDQFHNLTMANSETVDQFTARTLKILQALEKLADKPQPQTIEGIEYHVLKALPEKAYQYFKQKVRSATDKPKDEQEARDAFFLALRNFALSNKLNVGTDENNTQMVAQSAAMENPICGICEKGSHPTEACCHPDAPLGSCLDGPTKHKVINNQHALFKALKDGKTAKDWKDYVNTNSNRQSSKADTSKNKRKFKDKKGKGNQYEKKYKAQAAKMEELEQKHTELIERLNKGVTMQPAPTSAAPTFGASSVSTEQPQVFHFAAQTVRLDASPSATAKSEIAPINRDGNPYVHSSPELPVTELEALPITYVMEKVEEATVRLMLHSDEERTTLDRLLYVRDKAKAFDAAGVYHTTMIEDGTMTANAVTTGVIACELDTGAEKSFMMEGTPCLTDEEPTHLSCSMANGIPMPLKSKAVLRATYNGKTTDGMEMSSPTSLPVFVGKFARNLLSGLQLVQMGYTIVLAPGQCYISDKHGNRYPVKQGPRGFTVEFSIDAATKADSAHN